MAHERRYTEQLVILAEREPATQVRAAAKMYGQSEAQVLRDALAAGLPATLRKYGREAGRDPGEAAVELERLGREIESRRAAARARKGNGAGTHP